jgi:hypothetical protein
MPRYVITYILLSLPITAVSSAAILSVSGEVRAFAINTRPFSQEERNQNIVPTGGPGMVSGSATVDTSMSTAAANAIAQYGILRAHVETKARAPGIGQDSNAYARAVASWNELVTIADPALNGQRGVLSYSLLLSSGFFLDGDYSFGRVEILRPHGGFVSYSYQNGGPGQQPNQSGDTSLLNGVLNGQLEFVFGRPFNLRAQLAVTSQLITGGNDRRSVVDYLHTLAWAPNPTVTVGGAPVTGFTITSESGFDYLRGSAVPEPGTALLAAGALCAVYLRRRLS